MQDWQGIYVTSRRHCAGTVRNTAAIESTCTRELSKHLSDKKRPGYCLFGFVGVKFQISHNVPRRLFHTVLSPLAQRQNTTIQGNNVQMVQVQRQCNGAALFRADHCALCGGWGCKHTQGEQGHDTLERAEHCRRAEDHQAALIRRRPGQE